MSDIKDTPSAGGEVEVLAPIGKIFDQKYNSVVFYRGTGDQTKRYHPPGTEFVALDTAMDLITQLTAERDTLKAEVTDKQALLSKALDNTGLVLDELTKAREFNKRLGTEVIQLLTFLEDDFDNLQLEDSSLPISTQQWNKVGKLAADTLADQSAPAAKGA